MSAPKKLYWEPTIGGMGGAHDLLMADDGKYVGRFYADAREGVDIDAVKALVVAAPELLEAALATRKLVVEAALTGFNYADGDWAERLYHNQAALSAAIARATVQP